MELESSIINLDIYTILEYLGFNLLRSEAKAWLASLASLASAPQP